MKEKFMKPWKIMVVGTVLVIASELVSFHHYEKDDWRYAVGSALFYNALYSLVVAIKRTTVRE
jgi:predicted naringenin-chalcone synthase